MGSIRLSDSIGLSARYSRIKSRDLGDGDLIGLDSSINLSSDANLNLSATRSTQPGGQNNDSIFASVSVNLGNNTRGNVGFQQQQGNSSGIFAQVEKSLGISEDFGYRIGSVYK